ncbi:IS4/IS5 family transposase [Deinococcus wulumuqiensis]|uniref:IS4/IS5 family transposase n=1 Tax=Deinococcus wulumuqiensis TaxID=980427 RepID=A0A345IJB8_9DEIO|nr:transposase [Deinococcus wulumuqiensis]AXG99790.1 IS4/IS5 family transposase [Deinococcus wulumuqiensis]
MRTSQLLEYFSLPDLFTLAYVLVDDHLQLLSAMGSYQLPMARNRQATPSELITIALVGDLLGQKNSETWFALVRQLYADLFPHLPERSRYHRHLLAARHLIASFGLSLSPKDADILIIDSKPLPIAQGARMKRPRQQSEAKIGPGSMGWVMGYKLHGVVDTQGYFTKFAIVAANESEQGVARELLSEYERSRTLGDKGYVGSGVYAKSREDAKTPVAWPPVLGKVRKRIESVFSRLARCCSLGEVQLNSFQAVVARTCRAVAAHNLMLHLERYVRSAA